MAAEAAVLAEDREAADWYRLEPRRQLILDRLTELAEADPSVVDQPQWILDRPQPHYSAPPEVRAPHALAGGAQRSALRLFDDGTRRMGPFARLRATRCAAQQPHIPETEETP